MSTERPPDEDLDLEGLGLVVGLVALVFANRAAAALIVLFTHRRPVESSTYWLLHVGLAGLISLGMGLYLRHKAALVCSLHYLIRRATPMPAQLVNDHDDVWLEGRLRCEPLSPDGVPEVVCAWFRQVTEQRDRNWLERWLAEPDKMLEEKDPLAMALMAKYNNVPMPNMQLNEIEVQAILEHMEEASNRIEKHVKTAVKGSPDGMSVTTWLPFPLAIAAGDQAVLVAGCDRQLTTCKDKFRNLVNFGGFAAFAPNTDQVFEIPKQTS